MTGFIPNEENQEKENIDYKDLVGSLVRVILKGNSSLIGRLESIKANRAILRPTLIRENYKNKKGVWNPSYRLEQRLPCIIDTHDISVVEPASPDWINYMAQQQVDFRKIIPGE